MDISAFLSSGFKWILSSTPAALAAILLLLAARSRLGGRLHPKLLYVCWIALIVRLVFPWFPTIDMNVGAIMPASWQSAAHSTEGVAAGHKGPADAGGQAGAAWAETPAAEGLTNAADGKLGQATAGSGSAVWKLLFETAANLWLTGAFVIAAYYAVAQWRWHRKLKADVSPLTDERLAAYLEKCKSRLGIKRPVALRQTRLIASPAAYGLIKPSILIPEGMADSLGEEDWKCVMLHELIHIRRKDALWNILMTALVALHWFNPFMWKAALAMREDQELSCDNIVIKHVDRKVYGHALLKVMQLRMTAGQAPLTPFASGKKRLIKRRMEMIVSNKKSAFTLLAACFAVVVIAVAFTNASIRADQSPAEKEPAFAQPAEGDINVRFGDEVPVNRTETAVSTYMSIRNELGTPVYAAGDGKVEISGYDPQLGNHIAIVHDDQYASAYSHLDTLLVEAGQQVTKGQQIGTIGSTGRSTGFHLKFELQKDRVSVDPEPLLEP